MKIIKDDYISKLEAVQILQKAYMDGRIQAKDGCASVLDDISAVKAADVQPIDRWISVNDKLPEQDENVLVFTKDKDIMTMIYKVIPFRWYKPKFGGFDKDYVTHWKPRPEKPQD